MANTTDYTRLLDGYALLAIKEYIKNNYAAKSHTHTKSQITDFPSSMPASDVYAWAKASAKPGYNLDEVTDGSTRKLSNYVPLYYTSLNSAGGNGTYLYYRILKITNSGTYINRPIFVECYGRGRKRSVLTIIFRSSNTEDPDIWCFESTHETYYYLKKSSAKTWYLYTAMSETWGTIHIGRIWGEGLSAGITATIEFAYLESLPSDPIQATCSYALPGQAQPASDVYAWAKAATKPSYTHNEIGAGVLTIGDGANRLMFRTNASYANGIYYSTPGNEALVFATKYNLTSWIFATTDPTQKAAWTGLTPSLQIKNGRVTINKLIAGGTDAAYNLDVNGTLNATTIYQNGSALATVATSGSYNDLSNTPTIPTKSSWNYDDRYVKLTETQTISGVKTFDSVIQAAAGINIGNTNSVKPIVINSSTSGNKFVRLYPTTNNSSNFDIYLPAAAGTLALVGDNNHSHTLSIASGGTASINLAANTTYTLTAGGKTYAFKTPPAGGSGYYSNQYNATYYLTSNSGAGFFAEDIQAGVSIVGINAGNAITLGIGWPGLEADSSKKSLMFNGNRVDLILTDNYQYYIKGLSIDMYDDDYYTLHIRANDYSDVTGSVSSENGAAVKLHASSFEYEPSYINSAVTYNKYVKLGVVMHNINYTYSSTVLLKMNIRGNRASEAAVTSYANLCGLLYYAGHRSAATCLTCSGRYSSYTNIVLGVYATAYNSGLYLVYCSASSNTVSTIQIANGTVTDTLSASLVP